MTLLAKRLRKAGVAVVDRRFRFALAHGVVAATEHAPVLAEFPWATVFDVGANRGQFALAARAYTDATVYCLEPLPVASRTLGRVFADDDSVVLYEVAVGSKAGVGQLYVTRADDSSSLRFPVNDRNQRHLKAASCVEVEVVRLDQLLDDGLVHLHAPALLKIDVQGGELDVLKGAASYLSGFRGVYVEMSSEEIYHSQPLFSDVADHLYSCGFSLDNLFNPEVRKGKVVQVDALFLRSGARNT